MKKRIVTLLCTTILTLGLAAAPAMASAGPYSPIEVEAYTYGPLDEPRVNKVYRLSATDDPSRISTEDFVRGNRRYYFLDMIVDNADREVVTYTAVFGSEELTKGELYAGTSDKSGHQALYAGIAGMGNGLDLLPFWVCAGCMAIAAAIELCDIKSKQKGEAK